MVTPTVLSIHPLPCDCSPCVQPQLELFWINAWRKKNTQNKSWKWLTARHTTHTHTHTHIIYMYIYRKFTANLSMWGSLRLAPIREAVDCLAFYLGMATEILNLPWLCITRIMANYKHPSKNLGTSVHKSPAERWEHTMMIPVAHCHGHADKSAY